ncbi:MAG: hypothetical protein E6I07_04375 [Chloroflexi bacterium]|nr:MAG: hypothetical protein E6I07_04375 [Chloroflexota bacterium]
MAVARFLSREGPVRLVLVLATGFALGSCSSPVTADEVAKKPEAHLFYPGSHVVKTTPRAEQITEGGISMAMVESELSVDAPVDDIYRWYRSELSARGWTLRKEVRVEGSYDLFSRGDRELFQISAGYPPGSLRTRLAIVPGPCATNPPTKLAFANC